MATEPLTDEEIAELRRWQAGADLDETAERQIQRALDEVVERRARDPDHAAVMDIAHTDATAQREWAGRVRKLLPRIDEEVYCGERGVQLGRNALDLLREIAALLR